MRGSEVPGVVAVPSGVWAKEAPLTFQGYVILDLRGPQPGSRKVKTDLCQ